jgi:hypothetical protein
MSKIQYLFEKIDKELEKRIDHARFDIEQCISLDKCNPFTQSINLGNTLIYEFEKMTYRIPQIIHTIENDYRFAFCTSSLGESNKIDRNGDILLGFICNDYCEDFNLISSNGVCLCNVSNNKKGDFIKPLYNKQFIPLLSLQYKEFHTNTSVVQPIYANLDHEMRVKIANAEFNFVDKENENLFTISNGEIHSKKTSNIFI